MIDAFQKASPSKQPDCPEDLRGLYENTYTCLLGKTVPLRSSYRFEF